jgi:general secretion pathway protein G
MNDHRYRRQRRAADAGFTLIEVLLVLIILVVLGSIVVPNLFGAKDTADLNTAKAQVNFIKSAIRTYRLKMDKFPAKLSDLYEKPSDAEEAKKWGTPFLEEKLKPDPWGNEYQYLAQGKHNAGGYDVWSNGPDGQSGTDDDIGNWN